VGASLLYGSLNIVVVVRGNGKQATLS